MIFERALRSVRLRSAAKRYARMLGPQLASDYGASENYTPAQIQQTARRLRLPTPFLSLGYAAFLPEEDFRTVMGLTLDETYAELRELLARFESARIPTAGIEPASPNSYAMSGGARSES